MRRAVLSNGGKLYIYTTAGVTAGSGGGQTLPQRAGDVASSAVAADIICVGPAGINDAPGGNLSLIQDAVLQTLQNIRALAPETPIIQWGYNTYGTNTNTANFEGAVANAVSGYGDPRIYYLPVSGDPLGQWITGSEATQPRPATAMPTTTFIPRT